MNGRMTQWAVLLGALVLLSLVLLYNSQMMQVPGGPPGAHPGSTAAAPAAPGSPGAPEPGAAAVRPDVSVLRVETADYAAQIDGFGEARAHFELTLAAQVAGQVIALGEGFDSGRQVQKGAVLVQLEDSDYRAAVAVAEDDLAAARLALLEEERQGAQAKAEWAASGLKGRPDSELVLRQPHLAAAKAALANAEAALVSARKDLDQTRIVAPFDALVVERHVAPGSYVQQGTEVVTLDSTDRVEVAVSLSVKDWRNLPDLSTLTSGDWPAEVARVEDGQRWPARVLRVERHLDETTRQRALILAVDGPLAQSPSLWPGTFLSVHIPGRVRDGLWRLPSAALSQRGEVWLLGADATLTHFAATPVFADGEAIFIAPPASLAGSPQRVLTHPLNGYLQGMVVSPREVSFDE